PAVWPELDAVIMRALARDPKDRYATADSMRDALRQIDDVFRRTIGAGATSSGVLSLGQRDDNDSSGDRNPGQGSGNHRSSGNGADSLPARGGLDDDRNRQRS